MSGNSDARDIAGVIASECVGARIRMLSRKISRIYDDAIRAHGLKFSQMNILTMVALHEPVAPVEIVRMLELEKSTLSRNVTLMEARGWIQILPGEGNGQLLRTTRVGRQLLAQAAPGWRDAQARVESMFGSPAATSLRRAADRVVRDDR